MDQTDNKTSYRLEKKKPAAHTKKAKSRDAEITQTPNLAY